MLIRLVLHHFQGDKGVKLGLGIYFFLIAACIIIDVAIK